MFDLHMHTPDSKIEYYDRFEEFIDFVSNQNKEFIVLGDFNRNLLSQEIDRDCGKEFCE